MKLYIQFTDYSDVDDLISRKNDLLLFGKLIKIQIEQDRHLEDYIVQLPSDRYEATLVLNALYSYCAIHKIATQLIFD